MVVNSLYSPRLIFYSGPPVEGIDTQPTLRARDLRENFPYLLWIDLSDKSRNNNR